MGSASPALDVLTVTPDNARDRVLALIAGATSRLLVYNQSLDDSEVIDALLAAKRRRVDVHVLLGMQPGFGGKPPANQDAIDQLQAAGVAAGFFTRHYLHGKAIVADDRAFIGSQNFTSGGLGPNREVGEIFGGQGAAASEQKLVSDLDTLFQLDEREPAPR
jgi:phosphatidylserine/phosphatidylglycerophosphate/cardiolipin synthase-like enzyme